MPSYEQSPLPSWTKPIPQSRDRLQAIILVSVTSLLLFLVLCLTVFELSKANNPTDIYFALAVGTLSILFAALVSFMRAGTPGASLYGAVLCFCITFYSTRYPPGSTLLFLSTELPALFTLFLFSFLATRIGKQHKAILHVAESGHGRSTAQVAANLSVAALVISPLVYMPVYFLGAHRSPRFFLLMSLAALAEATADTVSSELGQVFGGRPHLLTTLKPVPIGTDGAITLLGTLLGILAAAAVIVVGALSLHLHRRGFVIALAAATIGLFADSLLGATLERKGCLGNDLVNFTSTLIAAITAAILIKFFY